MVYIVIYQHNTFQLKILCFKLLNFTFLEILSLKMSQELSNNSDKNLLICP